MTSGPVVVIGTGHAGFHIAQSLRENGSTVPITLIGEESDLPYERPPLSKAYLKSGTRVEFRPSTFYSDRSIDLRVGRAVRIDRAHGILTLANGSLLPYGHLVLATGSAARALPIPGRELTGVMGLRTLGDAEALRQALHTARRVVVIGGGFIGLEATAAAIAAGAQVQVLEAAPRLMGRAVSAPVSDHLLHKHRDGGVTVRLDTKVIGIVGRHGRCTGVQLDSGENLDADLVLVGVGSVPRAELAEAAGLAVDDGIKVDEVLLTADPSISAIGDCARFPVHQSVPPRTTRLESVQNAVDQARCVAARLTGNPHPYAAVPWFWSDQAGLKLQMAGHPGSHDTELIRPGREPGRFSVMLFAGGRLVGAESVNSPGDHVAVRKLLATGRQVTQSQATDPTTDLRSLAS